MIKSIEQTWDAVEEYFECVVECDLEDKECVEKCVLTLREDTHK
jgi:hypothetical protein